MAKHPIVFDTEIIGDKKPVFLARFLNLKTRQPHIFWHHKRGHMKAMAELLANPKYTFVGFNSENFDRPIIAAAVQGFDTIDLKFIANAIITENIRSWQAYKQFGIDFLEYDHIDLIEVAPGVMTSLKTYAGRMSYPTLVDMPFDHTDDLKPAQLPIVEAYCENDIGITTELKHRLEVEMKLRVEMSAEYGMDLRSKSDAQIAEAILKAKCGIRNGDKTVPNYVTYSAPSFIVSNNPIINELIGKLEHHRFTINKGNGSPEVPEFLNEDFQLGFGTYQAGVGGLHSTHDNQIYLEATETTLLSDFDVASYYPNIILKVGLVPRLGGGKGQLFIDEYRNIYERRMEAKRAGNKRLANSLKIVLNGLFGKLGSIFCAFYSPDLLLAVTITGQLNLLCLISDLEKIPGVLVRSANTDGMLVEYPAKVRDKVLKVFSRNAKRTGFEYEETQYVKYAAKDVNNYLAIKPDGTVKRKGLYASADPAENPLYLMKNPTMEVCTMLVIDYLVHGVKPEQAIKKYKRMEDFVAIRNVKGGGIQHLRTTAVDDWEQTPEGWVYPGMTTKPVKRKSRPAPREVGVGGTPFGRVARWYMTKDVLPPLTYVKTGNTVPKTEGAKVCMTLPKRLPADLDKDWYVQEAYRILSDLGVSLS